MNSMGASRRKKGIPMAAMAMGLMMAPAWALAQTVAATASGQAPTAPWGPTVPFYYGSGMMGGAWGPGYYGPDMMGGFGLFWGLLCLLIIAGVVIGLAFLTRMAFVCRHSHGCRSGVSDNGSTALKLLSERYARGEIGRDEYLEKRSDLEK